MDESEIESRIRALEDIEIPRVRSRYDRLLYEFLDSGCFPSPALQRDLDAAKEDFIHHVEELDELKRLLFYMDEAD
ncbi:MAG: hypothetical protein K6G00_07010 [Treponema sp.]|nr:hypothetical protein [Treponema sp.]